MKWQIACIVVIFFLQFSTAQNLIPNGGFEEVKDGFPIGWKVVAGTPDLHDLSADRSVMDVERLRNGEFLESVGSEKLMGFYMYGKTTEAFSTELLQPLIADQAYHQLKARVLTGNACAVGLDIITVALTPKELEYSKAMRGYNTNIVELESEKTIKIEGKSWVDIACFFKATGRERYLTIGNFNDKNDSYIKSAEEMYIEGTTENSCTYLFIDNLQLLQKDLSETKPSPQAKKVITLEDITFEFGKSQIKEAAYPTLDTIYQELETLDTSFKIVGHTDNVGSIENNQKLSLERAKAVQKYLVKKGLAAERFEVEGKGEEVPKYDNETEEGRSKNRRVEILILENR
ncbi:MAG: OmpA family protein [Bacteroidota bacterium]